MRSRYRYELKIHTLVSDVITAEIITIDASATVHDATELMCTNHCSSIVVNWRNNADEFGVVVVSDIASKVLAKSLSPKRVKIYGIMSKSMISLAAKMNIVYAQSAFYPDSA